MISNDREFTILIVDDIEEDFMLINLAFKKCNFNKKIVWMPNGENILKYLDTENNFLDENNRLKPMIIFLDLNMPRIDGFEVLNGIRNHVNKDVRKIPIVIFSSSSSHFDINRSYLEGANLYVTKPSGYSSLLEFVESFTKFWNNFCAIPS
ncbi:MAG: response regulator [Janthinobacterium lividum]